MTSKKLDTGLSLTLTILAPRGMSSPAGLASVGNGLGDHGVLGIQSGQEADDDPVLPGRPPGFDGHGERLLHAVGVRPSAP